MDPKGPLPNQEPKTSPEDFYIAEIPEEEDDYDPPEPPVWFESMF